MRFELANDLIADVGRTVGAESEFWFAIAAQQRARQRGAQVQALASSEMLQVRATCLDGDWPEEQSSCRGRSTV